MHHKLHVVLYEPEIAGNVGSIMRTCVALGAQLHLIQPFGFFWDARFIKRSSVNNIDYLKYLIYDNYGDFISHVSKSAIVYYITRYSKQIYSDIKYKSKQNEEEVIYFIFGKESTGIPLPILKKHKSQCLRIPMSKCVRSLNLSNSVSIIMYEVVRQLNFPNLLSYDSFKDPDYL